MATKADELAIKFRNKRMEIGVEIQSGIELMGNFKTIKDAQVAMLSMRQRLLEESHTMLEHITSIRRKLKNEKGSHMETLSTDLQHRYQYNEKAMIIEGKTATTKEMLEIIENQLSYFNDSIRTVDNILYGVKTRVEIEKVLGI
tara:strand:- start:11350 stop:11781 length:432 start_codon:yes stop_codon:yes gene_type:complete